MMAEAETFASGNLLFAQKVHPYAYKYIGYNEPKWYIFWYQTQNDVQFELVNLNKYPWFTIQSNAVNQATISAKHTHGRSILSVFFLFHSQGLHMNSNEIFLPYNLHRYCWMITKKYWNPYKSNLPHMLCIEMFNLRGICLVFRWRNPSEIAIPVRNVWPLPVATVQFSHIFTICWFVWGKKTYFPLRRLNAISKFSIMHTHMHHSQLLIQFLQV